MTETEQSSSEAESEKTSEASLPTESDEQTETTETSEAAEATVMETTQQTTQPTVETSPWDTYGTFLDGIYDLVEFSFFDLNTDGRTELIAKIGTCEADYQYFFYTYQGSDVIYIGTVSGGHSYLASDGTYLIVAGGQMGYEWAYQITYDSVFRAYELFSRDVGMGEYTKFPYSVDVYYPESDAPATCPVSVDFVDVSTLVGIDYEEFTTEPSEYLGQILFTADPAVTNFCVYTLNVDEMAMYGDAVMNVSELLFSMEVLSEAHPLLLNITFYDVFPHHGVSFVDANGVTHYYYLTTSGMDGSLIFEEFYP